ncbi:MAG TPA: DUF1800 domain-containing protein [Phycisphaerae bacterium]|nr:DUF1800 domain-containing protein [Phycisphaerae bacterium]
MLRCFSLIIAFVLCQTPGQKPEASKHPVTKKWSPKIKVHSGLPTSKSWDAEMAAHLLRRAGFGGTPAQVNFLAGMSREQAVEYLINYDEIPFQPISIDVTPQWMPRGRPNEEKNANFQQQLMARQKSDMQQMQAIIGWWIRMMAESPRPLQEKLTLFWHGHFTSGFREVKSSRAMYLQNQLFREKGEGNLRNLLIAVTHDPAMILYLNTNQNHKGKPNENYARELMELFTMGTGHYSEQDIKEAARALTGIGIDPEKGESAFHSRQHDGTVKTFLGHTGNFGADDVIDIILAQPATAEHIAKRMWTFFAYENPEERVVRALAQVLRDSHYELKPMLKVMFMCDAFYNDKARFTHVKSPSELLIGTLRILEIAPMDTAGMNYSMRAMGQQLFQPPNVKGWDGGFSWITTSTLYNRYNMICSLIDGNDNQQTRQRRAMMRESAQASLGKEAPMMKSAEEEQLQPTFDPMNIVRAENLLTEDQIVDYFSLRLLQRPISDDRRGVLIESFKGDWKKSKGHEDRKAAAIRQLIKLIVSMPEYQLG